MKKYVRTVHVTHRASADFSEKIDTIIKEMQDDGLQVEVRYSSCYSTYSALILGYKEEV